MMKKLTCNGDNRLILVTSWLVSSLGPKISCKPSKVVMRSLSCCNSDDFFLSIDAKQHHALAFIQKMKGRPPVVQARQQTSLILK